MATPDCASTELTTNNSTLDLIVHAATLTLVDYSVEKQLLSSQVIVHSCGMRAFVGRVDIFMVFCSAVGDEPTEDVLAKITFR